MAYVTIIALLAIIQFQYFGVAVGRARGRHGVAAPAVTGDEQFERFHRAHQNTMEQLVVFLPALFACAYYAHELLAVGAGLLFLIGRAWYFRSYVADPATRGKGMLLTMVASLVMIIAALIGAVRTALQA